MTIRTPKARELCTKAEFDLYLQSLPRDVKKITTARLKQKVKRARALRDKYRKLASQQDREARGKGKPRGTRRSKGSGRTREKAQLFEEVLGRFQDALDASEAEDEKAAKKAPKKKAARAPAQKTKVKSKKKAAKKKAPKNKAKARASRPKPKRAATKKARKKKVAARKPKRTVKKSGVGKASSRTASQFKKTGRTRTRTHVSARGRRNQARRDARR